MITCEPKQYGSEKCHAYDRLGNPHHLVPYKDKKREGEMRPTTLRDIKENGWLPSVSAILAVMAKPGLDQWKKDTQFGACFDTILNWESNALKITPNRDLFQTQVNELAESRMTKARDLGAEIHAAIERYLRGVQGSQEYPENPYLPASELPYSKETEAAIYALMDLGVWGQPFSAERTFSSVLGYGGTQDFESGFVHADFKAVDNLSKRLDYPDRCAQLCAYCIGRVSCPLDGFNEDVIKHARLVNIFISTSEMGKYLIREWTMEEKKRGWALFRACYELWCVVNNYDPRISSAKHEET